MFRDFVLFVHFANRLHFLIVLLLAGLVAQPAETVPEALSATDISLQTRVETTEVPLDQLVVFRVEISWPGNMGRYKIAPLDQPVLTNLILEGSGSKNQLLNGPDGPRSVKLITYQLKPLELGMSYIDGMVVRYRDIKTGEEFELVTQRVAVKIVEGSVHSQDNFSSLIYVLLLVVFGATLAFFIIQYIRKRKTAEEVPVATMLAAAPEETYLEMLKSALQTGDQDPGTAVQDLSRLVRDYLKNEFSVSRSVSSREEILAKLQQANLEQQDLQTLDELIGQLDVIKFAGSAVDPAQLSTIFGTAEGFFLKRKQHWEDVRRRNDAG